MAGAPERLSSSLSRENKSDPACPGPSITLPLRKLLDGKAPMSAQLRRARTLWFAGAILTLSSGAIGLTATPAFAHTPNVTPSCTGLAVSLAEYDVGNGSNNRVTTTIDGVATVADFGASYSHTFTWSQTASHTWSVVVDANRAGGGDPTQYDVTFSGTWQACQPAPTTTTTLAPTTTTTLATTTTTTTVAPTTTTLVLSEAPTTTLGLSDTPTTTLVASGAPVPSTTVDLTDRQLPRTGNGSGQISILALAALGLGLILMVVRRSRPVSS